MKAAQSIKTGLRVLVCQPPGLFLSAHCRLVDLLLNIKLGKNFDELVVGGVANTHVG